MRLQATFLYATLLQGSNRKGNCTQSHVNERVIHGEKRYPTVSVVKTLATANVSETKQRFAKLAKLIPPVFRKIGTTLTKNTVDMSTCIGFQCTCS